MKKRCSWLILLAVWALLSGCTPPAPVPRATSAPSFTPNPTTTQSPIPEPTQISTLSTVLTSTLLAASVPTQISTPTLVSIPALSFATPSADLWSESGVSPDTWIPAHFQGMYPLWGNIGAFHIDGFQLHPLTYDNLSDYPVISPDRRYIAYESTLDDSSPFRTSVNIVAIDGGRAAQLLNYARDNSFGVWSPDSQHVAVLERWNTLIDIDLNGLAHQEIAHGVHQPRYEPTGNGIAYITKDGGVEWRNSIGIVSMIIPTPTLPMSTTVNDFDWMPDGRRVVYTLYEFHWSLHRDELPFKKYGVWITPIDHFAPTKLADDAHNVSVSPDGRVIAALSPADFGESCAIYHQIFLVLSPDLKSAQVIGTVSLDSIHSVDPNAHDIYGFENADWITDSVARGILITCEGKSRKQAFLFDLKYLRMIPIPLD